MSAALYNLYVKSVFELARSLVIKSEISAEAINLYLRRDGVDVNPYDPQSWRYYKNIAGDYHSTDSAIYVVSMDTFETILFSKANLEIHLATAKEYARGSRYYNELVAKYPTQELLINGILNPVDINVAIAAEDGDILWFEPTLVEENEYNLIPGIEQWIKRFLGRWAVWDYRFTDELYPAAILGVVAANLPSVIMNLRLANCKTNYAHSFHIREYLASNGRLDVYMDVLTKKQALFLYRNIRYIHRNAGKQGIFELLIERILTERAFPIVAYEMAQNDGDMPITIRPDVEMLQRPLNLRFSFGATPSYTVKAILEKEINLARDNPNLIADAELEIVEEMQSSGISVIPTKVLDSSVSDPQNIAVRTLADILLNEWMYRSCFGIYKAITSFVHPLTGEKIFLTADEAFVLWIYSECKRSGFTLTDIPMMEAQFINRPVPPTFTELRNASTKQFISDAFITKAQANLVPVGVTISTEAFYDTCVAIHERLKEHYLQYTSVHDFLAYGQAKGIVLRHYAIIPCEFFDNQSYSSWFSERALNFAGMTAYDFGLIATELLDNATGISLNRTTAITDIHKALVRLMAQLSSYSVQYITTENQVDSIRIDDPGVMIGGVVTKGISESFIRVHVPEVLAMQTKVTTLVKPTFVDTTDDLRVEFSVKGGSFDYRTGVKITSDTTATYHVNVPLSSVRVLSSEMNAVDLSDLFSDVYLDGFEPPENLERLFDDVFLDGFEA